MLWKKDWSGVERSGLEWSGQGDVMLEWSGVEWGGIALLFLSLKMYAKV